MEFKNDFAFDLLVGQMAEKELAFVLQGKRIEIKSDKRAHKTLQVFVEYKSRGKPSGLSTTQADYYCFEIQGVFVLITVVRLKLICRPYLNTNKDVCGGDCNTSQGVLLPTYALFQG